MPTSFKYLTLVIFLLSSFSLEATSTKELIAIPTHNYSTGVVIEEKNNWQDGSIQPSTLSVYERYSNSWYFNKKYFIDDKKSFELVNATPDITFKVGQLASFSIPSESNKTYDLRVINQQYFTYNPRKKTFNTPVKFTVLPTLSSKCQKIKVSQRQKSLEIPFCQLEKMNYQYFHPQKNKWVPIKATFNIVVTDKGQLSFGPGRPQEVENKKPKTTYSRWQKTCNPNFANSILTKIYQCHGEAKQHLQLDFLKRSFSSLGKKIKNLCLDFENHCLPTPKGDFQRCQRQMAILFKNHQKTLDHYFLSGNSPQSICYKNEYALKSMEDYIPTHLQKCRWRNNVTSVKLLKTDRTKICFGIPACYYQKGRERSGRWRNMKPVICQATPHNKCPHPWHCWEDKITRSLTSPSP